MKSKRKQATKEEQKIAKDVGGRLTPNSGATRFVKGDIRDAPSGHRIESKYTDARQYTLKLDDLHSIAEACRWNETPVLIVNFRRSDERYAIISYADYLDLQRNE